MYTSRAKTYMVQIIWNYDPLLLFSDEQRIGVEGLEKFQSKEAGSINKHHVQMGLPEGHSMLVYYAVALSQGANARTIVPCGNMYCPLPRLLSGYPRNLQTPFAQMHYKLMIRVHMEISMSLTWVWASISQRILSFKVCFTLVKHAVQNTWQCVLV